MSRSWWRGWRSWTSDAQLVTHTSACRRTHTSASPCHTSATRRAADAGFIFFPDGGCREFRAEEVRRFAFSHENSRFHNFTLHDYITHRLHDYTTTILRLLSSLYIYIYWLLTPVSHLSNPISYPLLPLSGRSPFSFISSFLSLLVARCSLLSTLCSPLSPLLLFGLPVAPR